MILLIDYIPLVLLYERATAIKLLRIKSMSIVYFSGAVQFFHRHRLYRKVIIYYIQEQVK